MLNLVGGRSRSADMTSWSHPMRMQAVHFSCFSDKSIAQRVAGYFSSKILRRIESKNINI
jgi:hypothetical protein